MGRDETKPEYVTRMELEERLEKERIRIQEDAERRLAAIAARVRVLESRVVLKQREIEELQVEQGDLETDQARIEEEGET